MAESVKKVRRCRVVDCTNEHLCMFLLPSAQPIKRQWLEFIFAGDTPAELPKAVHVCAKHFEKKCFTNLGGYESGFNTRLRIQSGSVPTIRDSEIKEEEGSPSHRASSLEFPTSVDVACLTDVPDRRTVCTQLSFRTLHPHYRCSGVQATVSCRDVGVGTSDAFNFSPTAERRASKRHRLDSEDELELENDPFEDSYVTSKGTHSVTALTEPTNSSEQSSNGKKHLVFESCLLQLFAECPVCERRCDVETEEKENFLSVKQRCPRCPFFRHWNSRPVHGDSLQH